MRVGDKMQFNQKFNADQVVTVLKIEGETCLIIFPSGYKLATRASGLWPINNPDYKPEQIDEKQLDLFKP